MAIRRSFIRREPEVDGVVKGKRADSRLLGGMLAFASMGVLRSRAKYSRSSISLRVSDLPI